MQEKGGKRADSASPLLFREAQHFRQWVFWVPLVVVTCLVWYEFYQQVINNNPSGSQPIPDWAAWTLAIIFGLGFPAAGLILRLITEVRPDGIRVRVFPFKGTIIPIKDVVEAEAREYSGQREYGGWGVRTTPRAGRAYTAYGRQGVQLWLKGDQRILLGTQRPKELVEVLGHAGVFVHS